MTAAIIDLAMRKRVKVRARPTREDSRRKGKRFDKAEGFAKTRREIEATPATSAQPGPTTYPDGWSHGHGSTGARRTRSGR